MSDKVNNTPASGSAHAATASDNPNAYSIARPSTPTVDINSMRTDSEVVVPNAPRRPNRGRVDVDGNVTVTTNTDANGIINGMTESPSAARSGLLWHQQDTTTFTGSPWWVGPPAVNGYLVNINDPFTMHGMPLSAAAPAFNPQPSWYQPEQPPQPPPHMGGSSGGSPPAPEGDASNNAGSSHRAADESNDRSSGSNSRNAQSSDDAGPVIINGSTPGSKGKQPVSSDPIPMAAATRCLCVPDVQADDFDENMLFGRVKALYSFKEDVQKNGIFGVKSDGHGNMTVYMFCDRKSTACTLKRKLQSGYPSTAFISQQEFEAAKIEIPDEIDRLFGKVILSATVKDGSLDRSFSLNTLTNMAKTAAAKFGDILTFETRYHNGGYRYSPTIARYEIEYDSVKDACDVILNTNNAFGVPNQQAQAEHIVILAQASTPEIVRGWVNRQSGTGHEYSGTGRTGTRLGPKGQPVTTHGYSNVPAVPQAKPTGFGAPPVYEAFDPLSGGHMKSWDGYVHPSISRPQDVIDQKIEDGSDCRTTLMVRNLPAHYTKDDFLRLLNTYCPGKFDFAYNRIDFNKNQSVGYGFVNFISASWLLVFVKACRGKLLSHDVYRRHMKPCAVSYANVQGYECLVAKFRNSSILEEADGCRPTLFWSDESAPSSAMVGQQRPWPRVDNDSKKARSMENAQTLGLYTPRRANGGRGGRGGRHSRYDRGTTAQQNDEQSTNYNVAANATMAPFGHVPRYQPQMVFDAHTQQFVPAAHPAYGGPLAAGSMLRSHTNGQLGYTQPVMPAFLAPVTFPDQGQAVTQDEFAPLLYTQKQQVQQYYRRI